jgi:hypothetical protein
MGHKLEYTTVCPLKCAHVQDATSLVLMPRTWRGFGNVVDAMVGYIPLANVRKYIERLKITKMLLANSYSGDMIN